MAKDTVSMTELFLQCVKILREKMVPIHYATLTELSLNRLGIAKSQVNWNRQIEDVREKLAEAGRFNLFYTGSEIGCLVGFRWWFLLSQRRFLNPTEGITIYGNATSGINGAFEALMRSSHYLKKTRASEERVNQGRAKGLVIEAHVVEWFEKRWPSIFIKPQNKGKWDCPCAHDFRLKVDGTIYEIDVSGEKLDGGFGNPGRGKRRVDFHLLCELDGANILWRDTKTGCDYNKDVFPEGGIWPELMIVWLNCAKHNIPYSKIKTHLKEKYGC